MLTFGRDSKGRRVLGKALCRKKRVGFRYALIGDCWHEKLRQTDCKSGIPYDWFGNHIWLSSFGTEFEV